MSLLSTHQVRHAFGDFDVFAGVSVSLTNDGKVGLVGPNGIGKTTLLLILAGLLQPTSGVVQRAKGRTLGYLRQEAVEAFAGREHTVYEEMITGFAGVREQEERLRAMEAEMERGDVTDSMLAEYGDAQELFELAGGYDYELRIQQTLEGLGFSRDKWNLPLSHLSGGQKTRALLARLLLEKHDLLILDEPTNHLDVQAVEWLEQTLRLWEGALLVVSHDRYFLDGVVNTIWDMSRAGIDSYRGNYSAFVQQRQERWERSQELFEREKERLAKEIDFVTRNIARASTNARAVGRLRQLSGDLVALDQLGIAGIQGKKWSEMGIGNVRPFSVIEAEGKLKELRGPGGRPPKLNLNLKVSRRSGELVLRTKSLVVGYPGNTLFSAEDIELHRTECAALIGPNGTGKTTLLRTLMGQLEPLSGEIRLGASLKISYFAQAHDQLDPERSVIDEIISHKPMPISEARNYLAHYLFRKDDVFKSVGALSGGERGRLALAILGLDGANFLLLDEPTNHLDIPAQEVLQEVLEQFEGTILLASHDRYLIDRLATQIWELRDGQLRVFQGSHQEFLTSRMAEPTPPSSVKPAKPASSPVRTNGTRAKALASLEGQIHAAEAALAQLSEALEHASANRALAEVERLGNEYATRQSELDSLMAQWSSLADA